MFGFFRFFLAFVVFYQHISGNHGYPAHYSVWGFYTLSGFLMALVLSTKYNGVTGLKAFFTNRFLRIYPTYWIVALFSLAVLLATIGLSNVNQFHPSMLVPQDIYSVVKNIVIFGLESGRNIRLVAPSWALSIELVYYIGIALVLVKSRKITWTYLIITITYLVYRSNLGFENYVNYLICGFPFACGVLIGHYRDKFKLSYINRYGYVLVPSIIISYLIFFKFIGYIDINPYGYGFIIHQIVISFMIMVLFTISIDKKSFAFKFDKVLGSLSYPIYLVHWPIAYLLNYLTGIEKGMMLFMLVIPFVILVSYGINIIEKQIDKLRMGDG